VIKAGERGRAHRPTSSMRTEERILNKQEPQKEKKVFKKKLKKKWGMMSQQVNEGLGAPKMNRHELTSVERM
jgi:hypothetical protein